MKQYFLTFITILFLTSLGYVATDVYLPSLPAIATYFNSNESNSQLTIFSYLISYALSPLFFGILSDQYGRKKIIICGLLITIVSTVLCIFSPNIYILIILRFFQGIGAGAIAIAARAILPDLFSGKTLAKVISYLTMTMPLFLSLAPVIGGYLEEQFNWKVVFIFLIVYICIVFALMQFFSESLKTSSKIKIHKLIPIYKQVTKNVPFMMYSGCMIFHNMGMIAYFTASPFIFQKILGLSPFSYGILYIYIGLSVIISSYIYTKIVEYKPLKFWLNIGAFLSLISGIIMIIFYLLKIQNTMSILLPTLIYFFAVPFCFSSATTKSLAFIKKDYGTAMGLQSTVRFLACALISLIFSIIPDTSSMPLALCFIICGILFYASLFLGIYFENKVKKRLSFS